VIRLGLAVMVAAVLAAACGASGNGLSIAGSSAVTSSPPASSSTGGSTGPPSPSCDPLAGCVTRQVAIGSTAAIAYDSGTLWAAAQPSGNLFGTLFRIDAATGKPTAAAVPLPPSADRYRMAVGDGGLWLAGAHQVWLIDPATGRPRATLDAGGSVTGMVSADGSVWAVAATPAGGVLLQIDPAQPAILHRHSLGAVLPSAITVATGQVWVADTAHDTVVQLRTKNLSVVRTLQLPRQQHWSPAQLTVVDGMLWVFVQGAVVGYDERTGVQKYTQRFAASPGGGDMAAGGSSLWVASTRPRTGRGVVLRLDAVTGNQIGHAVVIGGRVSALATGEGYLWAVDAGRGQLAQVTP
jgi:hypothetical protein